MKQKLEYSKQLEKEEEDIFELLNEADNKLFDIAEALGTMQEDGISPTEEQLQQFEDAQKKVAELDEKLETIRKKIMDAIDDIYTP